MDSLTQIVLGAACGEAVLGKKIGNKALLFGAIGGTIPDLDVITSRWFYSNEIDILAAHRGFSHSILFSVLGAFAFGWLVFKLYNSGKRKYTTTLKDWIWLFFWSLFTHIILDSFTPYGTQLFKPFSEFRVAFNNISVVDIMYTIPFLICMIVLMFFNRKSNRRRLWLKLGLGISSAYMIFTIGNKFYIDSVFEKSLTSNHIDYNRFRVQPTIFNNILWYGIAETNDNYYVGFYSLLDESSTVENWQKLPKNHALISSEKGIQTLSWFSDGYYNLFEEDEKNVFKYNDLRYPLLNAKDPNSSVFSFTIHKEGKRWNLNQTNTKPPTKEDFNAFVERIKGNK
jgi:inner membrane protein